MMTKGVLDQDELARQYVEEGHRMGLEEGRAAAYAAGYEEGWQEGVAVVVGEVCQYALQLAREKVGVLTVLQEHVIGGLNDVCALVDLIVGVAGMSDPADLDVLLVRLISVGTIDERGTSPAASAGEKQGVPEHLRPFVHRGGA